jgi:hypothetical protein
MARRWQCVSAEYGVVRNPALFTLGILRMELLKASHGVYNCGDRTLTLVRARWTRLGDVSGASGREYDKLG